MDLQLALTSFVTVFLAELGDKTQLTTLALAAEGRSKLSVFVGSALALTATSLLAVLGGESLSRLISPLTLQRSAGVLFLALGATTLWRAR